MSPDIRNLSRAGLAWIAARPAVAMSLALIPFLVLLGRAWSSHPDVGTGDYAQYLAHASALLDGRPYADTGYLFNPLAWGWAPTAYPPGWPLTLAAAGLVFGLDVGMAKLLVASFGLALLVLAGRYFHRAAGLAMGVAVVLVLGLSDPLIEFSIAPVSDVPFALLVWSLILIAEVPGRWTWRRALAVTGLAGVAVLFRPHGMILIPALALWVGLGWKRAGPWVALPPAILMTATLIGRLLIPPSLLRTIPTVPQLLENLSRASTRDLLSIFESHLYPLPTNPLNDAYHVVTLLLMAVGLVAFVRGELRRFSVWFALMYAVGLVIVDFWAIQTRFALPLFPLFVFGLLNGIRVVAERLRAGSGRGFATGFALVLVLLTSVEAFTTERQPRAMDAPAFREVVGHIQNRVSSGEALRIASVRPRILAWETGAPGLVLLRQADPALHLSTWCDFAITHVILGPGREEQGTTARSRAALATRSDAFELEYRNAEYEVYRFDARRACPDR